MKRAVGVGVLAVVVLGGWAGCSSIIGIEEARLDSTPQEGGPPPTLCDEYCDTVAENCKDLTDEGGPNFLLYFSRAECMATCAVFPEGQEGAESGNSIHCRLRAATLAAQLQEPEEYCPRAGPGGNDGCGTNCEGFCTMALAVCPAEFERLGSDISGDTCHTICDGLPDLGGFDIEQDEGNSVQCRIYHVSAATLDARTHCAHVANLTNTMPPKVGGPCQAETDGG